MNSFIVDTHKYFNSIKKIKSYIAYEFIFPLNWKMTKDFKNTKHDLSQTNNGLVLTILSEISEQDITKTQGIIYDIIEHNLELEEKERLFKSKVSELKSIFAKSDLEHLKTLTFDTESFFDEESEEKTELEDEQPKDKSQ